MGTAKLETKNISALNILSNVILHIIGMEIEYILGGCTLHFLIRHDEVYVYVKNIDQFSSQRQWIAIKRSRFKL